ncbi:MAG TPA: hypothetical protein VN377_06440, partial [Candidatus Thermoplasmatota archaeon]|nr:hypothetical protein [Candidatus Thermoplasmatota archaeon]
AIYLYKWITVVQQDFIRKKTTVHCMIVIGLLSTEEEAQEIQFIAKICTVENRIRYLSHVGRIKKLVNEESKL